MYLGASQPGTTILWQTPLDDDRSYYGGVGSDVLIHFGAPMVSAANTVVHGFRFTTTGPNYDNWSVIGRAASNGTQVWRMDTDYSAAIIWPNDWTSVFPMTLFSTSANGSGQGVAAAGSGGSLLVRSSADLPSANTSRYIFYTSLSDFNQNSKAYAPVKICTPLTADKFGNIYFGYEVTGSVPSNLGPLGSGGIVKVSALSGAATYVSAGKLGISQSVSRPAINAAPVLSNDGSSVYFAMLGNDNVLIKCSTSLLAVQASVTLMDPAVAGQQARLINESSGSPMVGPDGHVFMGVFGYQWRESHGWMLQFDANLKPTDSNGVTFPAGAFGWDDTPSVVPAYCVPSYKGKAAYLILTKYNNYDMGGDPGADGSNHIAILDPTSNSISRDRQSGIPVMNEVITILGQQKINNDPSHPNATYEWCINAAAVDVKTKSAILNSEDGHFYRWDFTTNKATEVLELQPATAEAYTETAIGPDGQIYAINNTYLLAIGSPPAVAVSTFAGTYVSGGLSDIQFADGKTYNVQAKLSGGVAQAGVEADFVTLATTPTQLTVSSTATAPTGATLQLYVYNFSTKNYTYLGAVPGTGSATQISGSLSQNASDYVGPSGSMKAVVRAVLPPRIGASNFVLAVDRISCGAH